MRKILMVGPYSPIGVGYGGIAQSTGAYIGALQLCGHRVSLLCGLTSDGAPHTAEDIELRFPGLTAFGYKASVSKRWGVGAGALSAPRLIAQHEAVIIHGLLSAPAILAAISSVVMGKPYYIVCHATLDTSRNEATRAKHPVLFGAIRPLILALARRASGLIVSGKLERVALPPELSGAKIFEIENFFPRRNAERRSSPPPIEDRRYIFVGRLEPDKGILAFVKVWKATASPSSRLTVVGSGSGPYYDQLMSEVGSDDRIEALGELPYEQTQAQIERAHFLVLPTGMDIPVTENFGNVVAEALMIGRPVLVTTGLHWDQYADRDCVLRFAPSDTGAVAQIEKCERMSETEYNGLADKAFELGREFTDIGAVPKLVAALGDQPE